MNSTFFIKLFFIIILIILLITKSKFKYILREDLYKKSIIVEIKGVNSGIYEISKGTTIAELIKDLKDQNFNKELLNLSYELSNNDVIHLESNKISSINNISLEELEAIPVINKKIAQLIINYRIEKGMIKDLDELLKIKGIGVKTLEKLKKYISL